MRILYATDGVAAAQAGADLITALGNRKTVEVTVLSVIDTEPLVPSEYYIDPEVMAEIRAEAQQVVDGQVAKLREAGFVAAGELTEGPAGPTIAELGGTYDLVVLGAGKHSWLGQLLMGGTSSVVLHSSPASVLIVHDAPATPANLRVLLATDGSPGARHAAALVGELVDPERCGVTVLSVAHVPYTSVMGHPYGALAGAGSELAEELVGQARGHAEAAAALLRAKGFRTEVIATDGVPHHQVLDEARAGQYDLVVVGSRGHGPLRRSLLGSVSDAVVRHARAGLVARLSLEEGAGG